MFLWIFYEIILFRIYLKFKQPNKTYKVKLNHRNLVIQSRYKLDIKKNDNGFYIHLKTTVTQI